MDIKIAGRPPVDLEKPLLVVIDDNDDFRASLCGLIQSMGYRVVHHSTAEAYLLSHAPGSAKCIICDLQIPGGMDGMELLRSVREREPGVAVILMSAFCDESFGECARRAGAHCFLRKPFMIDSLLECVSSAIGAGSRL
jgi:FixJ family two-component response regulator